MMLVLQLLKIEINQPEVDRVHQNCLEYKKMPHLFTCRESHILAQFLECDLQYVGQLC